MVLPHMNTDRQVVNPNSSLADQMKQMQNNMKLDEQAPRSKRMMHDRSQRPSLASVGAIISNYNTERG